MQKLKLALRRALYKDACLFVVPGSHQVPRTPEQRSLSTTSEAPVSPLEMPGAIQVVLQRTSTSPLTPSLS